MRVVGEGTEEGEEEQRRGKENLSELYYSDGGRSEKKSKERHIFIEGVTMGLARSLAL